MATRSAGIILYRRNGASIEVLLVHPGGPFWAKKDWGAWSIPKGIFEEGEDALAAAQREFFEETGSHVDGEFTKLGDFRQPSGKIVSAWSIEGDFDPSGLTSNTFSMEWPPKSGKSELFPEVDRAAWFRPHESLQKSLKGQVPILEKLFERLNITVAAEPISQPQPPTSAQGSLF